MESITQKQIETKIMTITPDLAREWLSKNFHNRTLNERHILFLEREIRECKWKLNGESIKFSQRGHLLDGQHRLNAVIRANKSIDSIVIYNIPEESKIVMDTGRTRSHADIVSLSFRDVKNVHTVASSAKFILMYDRGRFGQLTSISGGDRYYNPDNVDILEFLKHNNSFFGFINDAMSLYWKGDKLLTPKIFCGTKWLTDQVNIEKSDSFFRELSLGYDLKETNPIYALRSLLIKAKHGTKLTHAIRGSDYVKILFMVWNKYVQGEDMQVIRWKNKDIEFLIGRPPRNIPEEKK